MEDTRLLIVSDVRRFSEKGTAGMQLPAPATCCHQSCLLTTYKASQSPLPKPSVLSHTGHALRTALG